MKGQFTGEYDQWKYLKWKHENKITDADILGVLPTGYKEWSFILTGKNSTLPMLWIDFGRFAMWYV